MRVMLSQMASTEHGLLTQSKGDMCEEQEEVIPVPGGLFCTGPIL